MKSVKNKATPFYILIAGVSGCLQMRASHACATGCVVGVDHNTTNQIYQPSQSPSGQVALKLLTERMLSMLVRAKGNKEWKERERGR